MKRLLFVLPFLAFLLLGFNNLQKQSFEIDSLLTNGGFESGQAGYTNFGSGTFSIVTSGVNLGKPGATGQFDAAANLDTLTSPQFTLINSLHGDACIGKIQYKTTEAALLTLRVIDGALAVQGSPLVLPASGGVFVEGKVTFTCPSSGTIALQILATGNAAVIFLDEMFLGRDFTLAANAIVTPLAGVMSLVRGSVTPQVATCDLDQGEGFSVINGSVGICDITFDTAFASIPSCVLSADEHNGICNTQSMIATGGQIQGRDATGTLTDNLMCSFICVGPQ